MNKKYANYSAAVLYALCLLLMVFIGEAESIIAALVSALIVYLVLIIPWSLMTGALFGLFNAVKKQ